MNEGLPPPQDPYPVETRICPLCGCESYGDNIRYIARDTCFKCGVPMEIVAAA